MPKVVKAKNFVSNTAPKVVKGTENFRLSQEFLDSNQPQTEQINLIPDALKNPNDINNIAKVKGFKNIAEMNRYQQNNPNLYEAMGGNKFNPIPSKNPTMLTDEGKKIVSEAQKADEEYRDNLLRLQSAKDNVQKNKQIYEDTKNYKGYGNTEKILNYVGGVNKNLIDSAKSDYEKSATEYVAIKYHNETAAEKALADLEKQLKGLDDSENDIYSKLVYGYMRAGKTKEEAEKLAAEDNRVKAAKENNNDKEREDLKNEIDILRTALYGKYTVGEYLLENVNAGVARWNQSLSATADFTVGNVLKAFGWENNPISQWNDWHKNASLNAQEVAYNAARSVGDKNNIGGQVTQGTVMALPDLLLAAATAGTSKVATLAPKASGLLNSARTAITAVAKNPNYWLSFGRELGMNYEEAKENGATETQATLYSLLASTVNAVVEVGGGIQTLPSDLQKAHGANKIWEWFKSSLEEGGEENIQGIISGLTEKLIYNPDKEVASFTNENAIINPKSMAKEFGMGVAVGEILGGGNLAFDTVVNAKSDSAYKKLGTAVLSDKNIDVNGVVDYAKKSLDDNIRSLALETNTNKITPKTAGILYQYAVADINSAINTPESIEVATKNYENILSSTQSSIINSIASSQYVLRLMENGVAEDAAMEQTNSLIQDMQNTADNNKVTFDLSAADAPMNDFEKSQANITGHKPLTEDQQKLREIGSQFGAKVKFENLTKRYTDENGVEQVWSPEGKYDKSTNTIILNTDVQPNHRPAMFILKHELAHSLEKAGISYEKFMGDVQLSEAFEEYAKSRKNSVTGENFKSAEEWYNDIIKRYNDAGVPLGSDGVSQLTAAKQEAIADFVADCLFTGNNRSVEKLLNGMQAKERNKFIAIIKEIIDKLKKVFANTSNLSEIERLENEFLKIADKVSKMNAKENEQQKTTTEDGSGVKYSIVDTFVDNNGKQYNNAVLLDTNFFDGLSTKNWGKKLKEYVNNRALKNSLIMPIVDEQGNVQNLQFAKPNERVSKNGKSAHKVLNELSSGSDNISKLSVVHIDEIVEISEESNPYYTNEHSHQWLDENGWLHRNAFVIRNTDGAIFNITLDIAKTRDGRTILYATKGKIKKVGNVNLNSLKLRGSRQNTNIEYSLPQKETNVKEKLKKLDTEYMSAVENGDMETAQRLVDEAAKSKGYDSPHLYHGTRSFGFTQFDLEKMDDKSSIFLTDNKKIASTYSGVTGARDISDVKETSKLSAKDLVKEFNAYDERFAEETTEGKGIYELYDFKKFNKLLNTVNRGIESLSKIVDKQIKTYAEKMAIDFDEKDWKIHNQLVNLLDKLKKYDYDNISTPIYMLLHHSEVFERSPQIAELESDIRLMNKLKNMDLSEGVITSNHLGGYDIQVMSIDTARIELENKYKQGNMALVAKLGKSLVIDGKNQNWNDIRNWQEAAYRKRDDVEIKKINDEFKLYDKATNTEIPNGTMAVNSFTEKLDKSALITIMLDNANYSLRILTEHLFNTREISNWAKSNGYDSVTIKNIRDNGGMNSAVSFLETADIYIIFNPNNVKSADPVTYDDKGNIIPLSERFKDDNPDIRYSLPENPTPEQIGEALKNGDINMEEYKRLINESFQQAIKTNGAIKPGEIVKKPNKPNPTPQSVKEDTKVSEHIRTILESGYATPEMEAYLKEKVLEGLGSYTPTSNEKNINKAVRNINAQGFQNALSSWRKSLEGINTSANTVATGEALLRLAMEHQDSVDVVNIAADLAELSTRTGQALQAFSLLKRMGGIGQLVYIQRAVNKLNNDLQKRFEKSKQDAPVVKINHKLASKLTKADTEGEYESFYEAIIKDVAEQVPPTFLDKWNAWRYMAMLFNPTTHFRNFFGNGLFWPAVRTKDVIALALEKSFVGKENRTKVLKVKEKYRDFAKDDFERVEKLLTGTGKYNPSDNIRDEQRIFKSKILEGIRKFNFDLLEKEDLIFLRSHYVHALGSFLQSRGINLSEVTTEQLDEARGYAFEEALKATYRDASKVANIMSSLSKTSPFANVVFEGIMPFKKTPINVLKRGVSYSPIGLIKSLSYGVYQLNRGSITSTQFIDGLASGATGTIPCVIGALLASLGVVKGGFDDEEEIDRLMGKQEYSVTIGNKSYTIDWAAPSSIPFFIGVALQEYKRDEDGDFLSNIYSLGLKGFEPILNLSMLSGINDVINSVSYKEEKANIPTIVGTAVGSYFSQALPTIFGKTANVADDTRRTKYIDKTSDVPEIVQSALDKIQSKVPFVSRNRAEYIDAWGETKYTGNFISRLFQQFVSPGYASTVDDREINNEVLRLYRSTKEKTVIPSVPAKYFEFKGIRRDLSKEEYFEYSTLRGQTQAELLEKLINNKDYIKLPDEQKAEVVENIYKFVDKFSKSTLSYSYDEVAAMQGGTDVLKKEKWNKLDRKAKRLLVNDYFFDNTQTKAYRAYSQGKDVSEIFIKQVIKKHKK